MPVKTKLEDAVTGQARCDHIVGFALSAFPQYGERDGLVRASENADADEAFKYCPLCGHALSDVSLLSISDSLKRTTRCEPLQSID